MPGQVITLLTDFGLADPYVGVMRGVILGIDPEATTVDLTHDVTPQDVLQGAFLLGTSWHYFSPGTIHIAVVDPDVGTERRALLVQGSEHAFLAPDNGLLSFVLPEQEVNGPLFQPYVGPVPPGFKAYALTNPRYWRHPVSATFHGRDIFAPAAAHLSLGVSPSELGEPVDSLTRLAVPVAQWRGNALVGYVLHIDRFGNVVTNIAEALVAEEQTLAIEIGGRRVEGLSATYAAREGLAALIGSHGNLEMVVKNGSAAQLLRVKVGDELQIIKS